ncbi:MAG: hypothetical protein GXP62_07430 [Oligoflexia bacterium]|nr:hypothetical protein [Oligoflexia bacterium]
MHRALYLGVIAVMFTATSCGPTKKDDSGDGGTASLTWYTTCGDPVCNTYTASAHTNSECSTETVGDSCSPEGAGCDLVDDCNTELVCATQDPKLGVGGCPISLRSAKTDIHYLSTADTSALHDQLMGVRLAGYRYKVEPKGTPDHLGFIIDDQPPGSPMVQPNGRRVDLYGYTSMAVAAVQVQQSLIAQQQTRIAAQDARIAALEHRLDALSAGKSAAPGSGSAP